MATDDGDTPDDLDGDLTPDDDHLRTLIREELAAALDGFKAPTPDDTGGAGADDAPATVKGVEAAVERAVQSAMTELQRKAAASKKSKPAPAARTTPDPEPTPDAPPTTILDKIRKAAWS